MIATLLLAAAASQVPVYVGRFNPSNFPHAVKVERRMPQGELNRRVESILAKQQCRFRGQNKRRFDLVIPYAVQMDPTGRATQVVVKDIGCEPLETLVGQVAVELLKSGDFRVQHPTGYRWYVTDLSFARLGEEASRNMANPDKIVCRQDKPAMGTRIVTIKQCKTVAEWVAHDLDRERFRRDIQSADQRDVE
jgi:hypothetical protein